MSLISKYRWVKKLFLSFTTQQPVPTVRSTPNQLLNHRLIVTDVFSSFQEVQLIAASSINSFGVKGLQDSPVDCDSDTQTWASPTTVGQWLSAKGIRWRRR